MLFSSILTYILLINSILNEKVRMVGMLFQKFFWGVIISSKKTKTILSETFAKTAKI